MTNDKKISEVVDIISEMIIKYIEDCRETKNDSELEELAAI